MSPAHPESGWTAGHTPGPWRVGADLVHIHPWWRDEDGSLSPHALHRNGFAKTIATVGKPEGDWRGIQQVADARLIAAAPDHALVCWAMCVQDATWEEWGTGKGEFCFAGLRYATTLDEFGAPVLTDALRAALNKATSA